MKFPLPLNFGMTLFKWISPSNETSEFFAPITSFREYFAKNSEVCRNFYLSLPPEQLDRGSCPNDQHDQQDTYIEQMLSPSLSDP